MEERGVLIPAPICLTAVKNETPPTHHARAPPPIRKSASFFGAKRFLKLNCFLISTCWMSYTESSFESTK